MSSLSGCADLQACGAPFKRRRSCYQDGLFERAGCVGEEVPREIRLDAVLELLYPRVQRSRRF